MMKVALIALLAVVAFAGVATANTPSCTVSNGILTLFNTPSSIHCVIRSDSNRAYISASAIAPTFVFGATVATTTSFDLTFFKDTSCSVPAQLPSISCTILPPTYCAIQGGKPVLLNVGPPAMCVRRDDTGEQITFSTGQTYVKVPLGSAILQDFCPIQVNLFKDSDCVHYLATQEIMCPCNSVEPTCVPPEQP